MPSHDAVYNLREKIKQLRREIEETKELWQNTVKIKPKTKVVEARPYPIYLEMSSDQLLQLFRKSRRYG